MGMFDDVNFKMNYPELRAEVDDFQSKDRECTLSTLEPDEVNNFYTTAVLVGRGSSSLASQHTKGAEKSLTLEQVQALLRDNRGAALTDFLLPVSRDSLTERRNRVLAGTSGWEEEPNDVREQDEHHWDEDQSNRWYYRRREETS